MLPSESTSLKGILPNVVMPLSSNSTRAEPTDMEHKRLFANCEMCKLPFSLFGGSNIYLMRSQMKGKCGLEQVSRTAMRPASRCARWLEVSSHWFLYSALPSPLMRTRYNMACPSTQSTNSFSPNSNFAGPACTRLPRSHAGSVPWTLKFRSSISSFADCSQPLKSMPTLYVPSGPSSGFTSVTNRGGASTPVALSCAGEAARGEPSVLPVTPAAAATMRP
mmetsp:Transcript_177730/g.569811  ORF Transcript_177730/g.569811 Transcript_177730/m.569811 type:complete len:221 (+) Transcript_177730:783-1445(+)